MSEEKPTVDKIVKLLYAVYDPELNVSLSEAGLVRSELIKIDEEKKKIWIVWIPTTPFCPIIPQIAASIKYLISYKYPNWDIEIRIHPEIPNAEMWNEQIKDKEFLNTIMEEIKAKGWLQYFIRPRPDVGVTDVPQ